MNVPDRGHIDTEQRNSRSDRLDTLSVEACLRVINDEDRAIADAVDAAIPSIAAFVEALIQRMRRGGRLFYVGAGTSGRLGVLDAAECPPTFQTDPGLVIGVIAGGDAALRRSSESLEDERSGARADLDKHNLTSTDTLLGIAAGGTTPYVLGAIEAAASRGCLTGFLTCSECPLPSGLDHHLLIRTGPEVVTGSTRMKAGTATKMVLNMISTTAMVQLGKVYGNLMVDLRATNDKLRDRAARIVATVCDIPRADALTHLDAADGSVRHAIIMCQRGLTLEEARHRLHAHGGNLRQAMEASK